MPIRRFALLALVAGAGVAGSSRPAHAQWAVFDASNVWQTTKTALATAQQVQQLAQQIRYMEDQLRNQAQTLRMMDPTSFSGLMDSINTITMAKNTLLSQVESISFSTQQVNADFRKLFPKDKKEWSQVESRDFDNRRADWNAEMTSSAQVAMRSQTQLEKIDQANNAAKQILIASGGADGEVRQLQGITQMLSVIQNQMSSLIQLLSTGSRVSASVAASDANKEMMLREAKKRRRHGYKDPGPPPRVLPRFP